MKKSKNCAVLLAVALSLVSCASRGPKPDGGAVGQVIRDARQVAEAGEASGSSHNGASVSDATSAKLSISPKVVPLVLNGERLKHNAFDIPVLINPKVEQWIRYFTGKGRFFFAKYLERGQYFIPEISKVLRSHGMPQDLVYLAMIESGFNNSARSRAQAVGPWQFIRQTGQRYGLRIDYWLDERRETQKSTLAAIAYLKELYQEFGSWELAASGYNAGENKVRRAIAKYRSNDFWEISKHRFFRRETRDYVPKIMAAAILAKNADHFGFVNPLAKTQNKILAALENSAENGAVPLAGSENDELTPKELGEEPEGKEETAEDVADAGAVADPATDLAEESVSVDDADEGAAALAIKTPNPVMTPSMYRVANPHEKIVAFELKGPADLFAVSKASGVPFSTLRALNPELRRWCTPPDLKTYRVRLPASVKDRFLATYNDENFDRKVEFLTYKVRRGDTMNGIARKFKTEVSPIREINALAERVSVPPIGSLLSLPLPTGSKRVLASLYDEKPYVTRRKRGRARRPGSRRGHRSHTKSAVSHSQRINPTLAESHRTGEK